MVVGSTNPTTDDILWVGGNAFLTGYASSTTGLYTQGDGHIGGDLTIDGSATTTSRLVIGAGNPTNDDLLWVGGKMTITDLITATSTQILATTTDTALTVRQGSTGNIVDIRDGAESAFLIADGGAITSVASSTSSIIGMRASTTDTHLLFKLTGSGPLVNVTNNADTSLFYMNNSGNIGIGTTTPPLALTVDGGGVCIDDGAGICGDKQGNIGTGDLFVGRDATTTRTFTVGTSTRGVRIYVSGETTTMEFY